jgi:hypothetical protein
MNGINSWASHLLGRLKQRFGAAELAIFASALLFAALEIYLHYRYIFWDFCAYLLSGEYLLGNGWYYEVFRPPVVPIFLAALGPTWYLLVSELLLAFSVLLFAKRHKLQALSLYVSLLTPVAAVVIATEGSEILASAFVFLALALVDSVWGAVFLALAFLTRYNFALFAIPFIYLAYPHYRKQPSLVLQHIVAIAAVLFPWLAFNYANFGHPLASVLDLWLINVPARQYLWSPINPAYLLVLVPTVFFAVPLRKRHAVWWFTALLAFVLFYATPVRAPRYLISVLLPLSVVSADNLSAIRKSLRRPLLYSLLFLSFSGALLYAAYADFPYLRSSLAPVVQNLNGCVAYSEVWVPLICSGARAVPYPPDPADFNSDFAVVTSFSDTPEYLTEAFLHARGYHGQYVNGYTVFLPAHCYRVPIHYVGEYLDFYNRRAGKHYTYSDLMLCILHLKRCELS